MENWSTKFVGNLRLIRTLGVIMGASVLTSVVLMFTLNVHQSVSAAQGIIVAENAPVSFLSPFEAELTRVNIRSGDRVRAGDTLLVLRNDAVASAYAQTQKDLELTLENIKIYEELLSITDARIEAQRKQKNGLYSTEKYDRTTAGLELSALARRTDAAKEQLRIAGDRLNKELRLYREGVISEAMYQANYQKYLTQQSAYTDLVKQYQQQKSAESNLSNTHSDRRSQRELEVLSTEFERVNTLQSLQQEKINQVKLERQLRREAENYNKLFLVAPNDGYISAFFNDQTQTSYLTKGQPLFTLTPEGDSNYFAKLTVSQEAVRDLRIGQQAKMKVNAYNHYMYGVLKGEVKHIDKDALNQFYAIVEIPEQQTDIQLKNGFQIKGEVIVKEVKLYKFIFHKMFAKA